MEDSISEARKARHKLNEEKKRQREEQKREEEEATRRRNDEKRQKRKSRSEAKKVEEDNVTRAYNAVNDKWESARKRLKDVKATQRELKKREAQLLKEHEMALKKKTPLQDLIPEEKEDDEEVSSTLVDSNAHGRLPFPNKIMQWAATAWYCATSFGDVFHLQKFTIDHFANALQATDESVLLIECVRRMLRTALADGDVQILSSAADEKSSSAITGDRAAKKRKKRKSSVSGLGEQVTPQNWESSLARSLGGLCDKLFFGGNADDDDDDDDDKNDSLESTAREAQAQLLGLKTTETTDDDDSDSKEDKDDMKDDDEPQVKKMTFVELDLELKVAAICVVALGALASRKLRQEVDNRKFQQEDEAKRRKEFLRNEKAKDRADQLEARDAAMAELKAERGLDEEDDSDNMEDKQSEAENKKLPTSAEVFKRLEQKKDSAILENRAEVTTVPVIDDVSDDESEETLEQQMNDEEEKEHVKTPKYFELRRELDGARQRNLKRKERREKKAFLETERTNVLTSLKSPEVAGNIAKMIRSMNSEDIVPCQFGDVHQLLAILKSLIKRGRRCFLFGGDDTDEPWVFRDMAEGLRSLEKLEKIAEGEKNSEAYRLRLASFDVRKEPLGYDRKGRAYWWIDDWNSNSKIPGYASNARFARVFRQTFATTDARLDGDAKRQEWACFIGRKDLQDLHASLSDLEAPERDLKHRLVLIFDIFHADDDDDEKPEKKVKALTEDDESGDSNDDEVLDASKKKVPKAEENWQRQGNDFIGRLVIRKFQRTYTEAVVVAYVPASDDDPPLWRVEHADGDEEDLEESELLQAIADHADAFKKYANAKTARTNAYIADYLSGANTMHIKRALVDYGYSNKQILDYLNNVD